MPWKSSFENGKWKVKSLVDGSVKGTHSTKSKADAQVRALYANSPEGKRGGGMVYPPGYKHGGIVDKNNLPATAPTRPSTLGQASSASSAGVRHGGALPKGMPTAGKPGQPYAGGMPRAVNVTPIDKRYGGAMPMKNYAGGKGLNQVNPDTTKLSKTAIGKQGAVAPGMRHGGTPGMAYPSMGANHEGTLPATTPGTNKLQPNVTGKGGAVLPGMRYGGKAGYRHGGEVVPGSGPSKNGLQENENGPGSGAKKSGYPFTSGSKANMGNKNYIVR